MMACMAVDAIALGGVATHHAFVTNHLLLLHVKLIVLEEAVSSSFVNEPQLHLCVAILLQGNKANRRNGWSRSVSIALHVKALTVLNWNLCVYVSQVKKWTAGQGKWTIVSMFLAVANFAAAPTGSSLITRFLKQPQTQSQKQPLTQNQAQSEPQTQTQTQSQTQSRSQTQTQPQIVQPKPAVGMQSSAQGQDVSGLQTTSGDLTDLHLNIEAAEAKSATDAPKHATSNAVTTATSLTEAHLRTDSSDAVVLLGAKLGETSKVHEAQPDKQKSKHGETNDRHMAQWGNKELERDATALDLMQHKPKRIAAPTAIVSDVQRLATRHTHADSTEHTATTQLADSAHAVHSRAAEHHQGIPRPQVAQQGLFPNRPDPAQQSSTNAAQHFAAHSRSADAASLATLSNNQHCAQPSAQCSPHRTAQHDVPSEHPEAENSRDITAQVEPESKSPESLAHQASAAIVSDKALKRPRKETREPDHRNKVRR